MNRNSETSVSGKMENELSSGLFTVNPEIRAKMEDVTEMQIVECQKSMYIKPMTMLYKQNGRKKFWDFIKTHDSVSIIIYNRTKHALVFVKQFRPGVYIHNTDWTVGKATVDVSKFPISAGVTYELCAGIVDKDLPLEVIAQQEVFEETGYSVRAEDLERITSMRSGVGIAGSLQTVYYVEVEDSQRTTTGGGSDKEGEMIEVVEVPLARVRTMMYDEKLARPGGFMFAMMWFFMHKFPEEYFHKENTTTST
ncbi:uridine diphosphate glucose pyrophosphatase NUDT14-like [Paramacrobiotus metropolitanus]|uniref:uridine diphosphate glucose pyrophosphatase NUDT14-like n=1 Tax=Paramacrobiotus metropolitanus TaxID=2943436 RepID=UPI0024465409|nr:uridine diphosphate glucose pyrophosphatase NUDT14-like [Paramacrobiotus metropolitanus]